MKTLQKIISYTLHPVVCPIIASLLYFMFSPRYTNAKQESAILFIVFVSTYAIPLLFMVILKRFNMISSIHLKTIEERKFPYVFMITLTFLLGNMLYRTGFVPLLAFYFYASAFAIAIAYLFLLLKIKVSLHTMGFGSIVGFLIAFSLHFQLNILPVIAVSMLLLGAVAMSRLYLNAHTAKEVYLGIFFGIACQFVSFLV